MKCEECGDEFIYGGDGFICDECMDMMDDDFDDDSDLYDDDDDDEGESDRLLEQQEMVDFAQDDCYDYLMDGPEYGDGDY